MSVPNSTDVYVGKRILNRRRELGMSRRVLGENLGVGLKQVNKYETAANRVSASRLYRISVVLGVPVAFFFDGCQNGTSAYTSGASHIPSVDTARTRALVNAYHTIPEGPRQRFLRLVRSIAESGDL